MKKGLWFSMFFALLLAPLLVDGQDALSPGRDYPYSLPAFDLVFPQSCLGGKVKWTMAKKDEQSDAIEFSGEQGITWTKGKYAYIMRIFSNPIFSDSVRALSNAAIADDFRNSEVKGMKEEGEARGMYKLADIRMYTDSISGKQFYVLSYANKFFGGQVLAGWLYLCLPREQDNEAIFCAFYAEIMNAFDYKKNYKAQQWGCFRAVLESVALK